MIEEGHDSQEQSVKITYGKQSQVKEVKVEGPVSMRETSVGVGPDSPSKDNNLTEDKLVEETK